MAGVGTSEVIEVSQEQVKRAMPKFDPTLYTQKPPDEEEVAIKAKFYNRSTGTFETTFKSSSIHKRKHQINSLAIAAAERELELMEKRGRATKTKAETNAKYGW